MFHRLFDSIMRIGFQISLVNSVTDDEHIIYTDSNEQERHQVVYTCNLSTEQVANTKTGGIGKTNTEKAHERKDESAVHAAECAQN